MPLMSLTGQMASLGQMGQMGSAGQMGQMGQMGAQAGAHADLGLLSQALAISRDGIIGADEIDAELPAELPESVLDDPERLRSLSSDWRAATIDGGLLSGVSVVSTSVDGTGAAQVLQCVNEASEPGTVTRTLRPVCEIRQPSRESLASQLDLVHGYADLRTERLPEILVQINDLVSFFGALDDFRIERAQWTLQLLGTALRFAHVVEAQVKHILGAPRPVLFSPKVQPVIETPTHGTLPSGHATEAFLLATILTHLAGEQVQEEIAAHSQRFRLAARIAINRTVAGVHFPVDSAAGAALGMSLGNHLAARATGGVPAGWMFDSNSWGDQDFHLGVLSPMLGDVDPDPSALRSLDTATPEPDAGLAWLWDQARAEWDARWR